MRNPGEVVVRRRAGVDADDWGSASVTNTIPEVAAEFLRGQRLLIVSARRDGEIWVTVLHGHPGFVQVVDESTLAITARIPAVDPLGTAFDDRQEIGILAIEPATRRRMRINGHVRAAGNQLLVATDQVYSNCPKYIQTRTITAERATPPGTQVVTPTLTSSQQRWVTSADTFFIGTGASGYGLDVSHRGGNPGFIDVLEPGRIAWPDYTGNSMFMTLGNLELDRHAGLLFIDWERGHTLHVAGRARVDWDEERAARHPGAHRIVDMEVHQVMQIDNRAPLSWQLNKYSRFNPSLRGT